MIRSNREEIFFSDLGNDANLEQKWAEDEAAAGAQEAADGAAQDAAEGAEEQLRGGPLNGGLTDAFPVAGHPPLLALFIQLNCFPREHADRHRELRPETEERPQ